MRRMLAILLTLIFPLGCGLDGGVANSTDLSPGGTVIFHGSFAANTNNVSGTVLIHNVNGQVVVRLEGLVTPSDTRYYLYLESSLSQTAYVTQLKAPLGNQNYYTGITQTTQDWIQVVFRGLNNVTFPILASAQLDP